MVLELVRADTLADPIPALPVSGEVDLAGLPTSSAACSDGPGCRESLCTTRVTRP